MAIRHHMAPAALTVAALTVAACAALGLALLGGVAEAASSRPSVTGAAASLPSSMVTYPYEYFQNDNSRKCLDIPGKSTRSGVQINQYTCSTGQNFGWLPVPEGNQAGEYVFRNENQIAPNDKCMTVAGGSDSAGAAVVQDPCDWSNPPASQEWLVFEGGVQGWGKFENVQSGYCLKIKDSSTSNNGLLIQQSCIGSATSLLWQLSDSLP